MPLLLVLLVLLAAPVAAQSDASPEAEALLRRWTQSVRLAHERLGEVSYAEEIEQVIDSPFTSQRLQILSDVIVRPDVDRPVRDVRRAELNGEAIAPIRVPFLQRRFRRAFGPGFATIERAAAIPLRALGSLRPVDNLVPVEVEGQAAWRLEAVAPRADVPLERATLWFTRDRDRPVLLRSQVVVRSPRAEPGTPTLVRTDYIDIEGLPFPRQRRVEATLQQRRRIRTFTVLVTLDLTFRDLDVTWR